MTEDKDKYIEELKQSLLYKTITAWDNNSLTLSDGTKVTIECSDYDCCAWAGGEFKDVTLDAIVTDVTIGEITTFGDPCDMTTNNVTTNNVTITVYHNQNPIALAECYADNGNGGYYYSVCSLVVNGVNHPVVSA